jgi:hypothetical protein
MVTTTIFIYLLHGVEYLVSLMVVSGLLFSGVDIQGVILDI